MITKIIIGVLCVIALIFWVWLVKNARKYGSEK